MDSRLMAKTATAPYVCHHTIMNTQNIRTQPAPSDSPTLRGTTILYEDRATGLRAKRFSDMLSASLGDGHPTEPACWRLELTDLPGLASEISDDTAASEFLLLSLRGDSSLSSSTKQWLESLLERAEAGTTSLIALFDPVRSVTPHAESMRCYLRQVTAQAGVTFFAHCSTTLDDSDQGPVDEDVEFATMAKPRLRRRRFAESVFPTALAASFLPAAIAI
ncbi:MAG: hypothetical protein P4L99_07530 [Chthoniobacter sp.]|nr:hypothetical protein [Chthoniobacter sp.]